MSNLASTYIKHSILAFKKKMIDVAFLLVSLFYIETPEGLTSDAHRTLIIVVLPNFNCFRVHTLPAIAMLILIMEVVLGVDTADGVASSFADDAFLLWGLYCSCCHCASRIR